MKIANLDPLLKELQTAIYTVKSLKEAPTEDAVDAARTLCLASRKALMTIRALRIDGVFLQEDDISRIYQGNRDAVAALNDLSNSNGTVLEFRALIEQRDDDLLAIHRDLHWQ